MQYMLPTLDHGCSIHGAVIVAVTTPTCDEAVKQAYCVFSSIFEL
jgi:hypothetical protein